MNTVIPIDSGQREDVVRRTRSYIDRAAGIFGRAFDPVTVVFNLRGKTPGMYRIIGERREIRYNPWLFSKYPDDSLANTVPHEVAHYIVEQVYGRRVRPHGREWKRLMRAFGAEPARTCSYDLEGIACRQYRLFTYHCSCREHQLTSRRHNQVVRAARQYLCRACGSALKHGAAV